MRAPARAGRRAARAACKLLEELKTVLAAYLDAKLAASPA
jgi:hypothetical protein